MKTCWARCIGNCSSIFSNEHIVSESLGKDDLIEISGFPWLKGKSKKLPLSSLTRNILCRDHNSNLSLVDTAGKETFSIFREMQEKLSTGQLLTKFSINGSLIERWFLKTLINFTYEGEYPIGNSIIKAGIPADELVEIAFGIKTFSTPCGLYLIHQEEPTIASDRIEFAPLIDKNKGYIAGGLFSFRGPRFLLFFGTDEPPQSLNEIKLGKTDLSGFKSHYHPERIELLNGKQIAQIATIKWTEGVVEQNKR
jgi:hypothetical protein